MAAVVENKIESISEDRLLVVPEKVFSDFPIITIQQEGGKVLAVIDVTDGGFVISSRKGISSKIEFTQSKGKIE